MSKRKYGFSIGDITSKKTPAVKTPAVKKSNNPKKKHPAEKTDTQSMITAPYNFVPLAEKVVFANELIKDNIEYVSHDIPFPDGMTGVIKCKLTTKSPVYIRNGGNWTHEDILSNKDAQSFFNVNGQYIIPGTSLKGMLRNVIEIVSFGKMNIVDDYKYSVKDAIKRTSKNHSSLKPDLAETIFGHIQKDDGLKGRVYISHAEADMKTVQRDELVHAILGGPKPTYYPNYIEQEPTESGKVKKYKTFMDDCQIRGWKRYPARKENATQSVLEQAKKNIKAAIDDKNGKEEELKTNTKFIPLQSGAKFGFDIRFHNLRPIELGAVIWALTWGGDKNRCHSLGMAKPFGLGQVEIECESAKIFEVSDPFKPKNKSILQKCLDGFISAMENVIPNWTESEQLKQLLAMADPTYKPWQSTQTGKLKYMQLNPKQRINDFVEAKKAMLYLLPHAQPDKQNKNKGKT